MNEQLGMAYGTACNKLRKMILFNSAIKLGEDSCFRCKQRIESIDEFTIEHKVPWRNGDTKLFWDLDNIAFSHAKCNRPHNFRGQPSKRRNELGEWLCKECQIHKPVEEFTLYNTGTPRQWCKVCRNLRSISGEVI